ncbi:MAG: hypothetical protein J5I98_33125 [Phaeodactylibacter sp.]|nr:hypothetical protein [Phaeodactylibacter sp.]
MKNTIFFFLLISSLSLSVPACSVFPVLGQEKDRQTAKEETDFYGRPKVPAKEVPVYAESDVPLPPASAIPEQPGRDTGREGTPGFYLYPGLQEENPGTGQDKSFASEQTNELFGKERIDHLTAPGAAGVETASRQLREPPPGRAASPEEMRIQNRLARLYALLNSERKKYHEEIHEMPGRLVKTEATELLLNIHHYMHNAYRFGEDSKGVTFIAETVFPANLPEAQRKEDAVKLARSFANALIRYEKTYSVSLGQLDSRVLAALCGHTPALQAAVQDELSRLGLPFWIEQAPGRNTSLRLTLLSHDIFEEPWRHWQAKEEQLKKEIHLLETQIKK